MSLRDVTFFAFRPLNSVFQLISPLFYSSRVVCWNILPCLADYQKKAEVRSRSQTKPTWLRTATDSLHLEPMNTYRHTQAIKDLRKRTQLTWRWPRAFSSAGSPNVSITTPIFPLRLDGKKNKPLHSSSQRPGYQTLTKHIPESLKRTVFSRVMVYNILLDPRHLLADLFHFPLWSTYTLNTFATPPPPAVCQHTPCPSGVACSRLTDCADQETMIFFSFRWERLCPLDDRTIIVLVVRNQTRGLSSVLDINFSYEYKTIKMH